VSAGAASVTGVGLWAPGYRDLAAWLRGTPDPAVTTAPAELIPAALRRRASALSRMVAEAARAAAAEAGADLSRASMVLGSGYGEIVAAVEMIGSFREAEGMPSPTKFHNSVHNAPLAYLSMATGNQGLATAIAAADATTATALQEAMAVLAERGGEVLVVLADEAVPAPLTPPAPWAAGAVALVLTDATRPTARARLGLPRRGTAPPIAMPPGFAAHPCAGGFALAAALASGRSGPVPLGPATDGWIVDLEPRSAA
jgi:3-oxoacyl-(acyl-carrier-protein) synthase